MKIWNENVLHISKTKYPFWMYPYKLWLQCPLTIQKYVSQNHKIVYFLPKRFITIKRHQHRCTWKRNRCSTVPAGWNLDINRCKYNDKTLFANWQVGDTLYVPIELYSFELQNLVTIQAANNKSADQTAWIRRLMCAFVVHKWKQQGFSWCGPLIP